MLDAIALHNDVTLALQFFLSCLRFFIVTVFQDTLMSEANFGYVLFAQLIESTRACR